MCINTHLKNLGKVIYETENPRWISTTERQKFKKNQKNVFFNTKNYRKSVYFYFFTIKK